MNTALFPTLLRRLSLLLGLLLLPTLGRADALSEIQTRGTVRIGVCAFAPWTFANRAGQLEGFEIDLGRQVAHDLGVKAEFKLYPLDEILDAVDRGDIDFIAAGLAITPARALRAEFSVPYYESGTTLVTHRKLAPGVRHPDGLNQKGFVVVLVADTFSAGLALQLFDVAAIKTVPNSAAAEAELVAGRAHGYLTNVADAHMVARRHPDLLEVPLAAPLVRSVAGLAVKRGNQALLNFLNAWITARSADNLLPTLNAYWFGNDDWTAHLADSPAAP